MEAIRGYLLSVTAAAVICAVVSALLGKKGTISAMGKLLTGIFLAITVISPLAKIQLSNADALWDDLSVDAAAAVAAGEEAANNELRAGIKSQTEAYILDKAASYAAELTVEVTLSDDDPPLPCAVRLTGSVSPYAKRQLQQLIAEDLGIPKEAQTWIG